MAAMRLADAFVSIFHSLNWLREFTTKQVTLVYSFVAHWLLQRCPGGFAESDDQQTATSVLNAAARVVSGTHKFDRAVWRLLPPPYRAALAGRPWASRVQARRHGVQLPARSSQPPYLVELCQPIAGVASRQHLWSATRQLLVVSRHQLSFNARRAFCVAGPSIWNSLPDSLPDPVIGGNRFRQSLKTFLFAMY